MSDGVCSACKTAEVFENLPKDFWDMRRKKFEEIINEVKLNRKSEYDCYF